MHFKRTQAAFTLLELLVVVFILGVILTFAVISVDAGGDERVREEARRLTALLKLANEEAIINSRDMALQLYRDAYQFVVIGPANERLPFDEEDRAFRPRELPDGMRLKAELVGEEAILRGADSEEPPPEIHILSSSEMTPFVLQVEDDDQQYQFQLHGDYSGQVEFDGRAQDAL